MIYLSASWAESYENGIEELEEGLLREKHTEN